MDTSIAHIVGAFTEAYRNRQRQKREADFYTLTNTSPSQSSDSFRVPLRVVYQVQNYLNRLSVRRTEGIVWVSAGMSYDALMGEMKQKAALLGITEDLCKVVALGAGGSEERHIVLTRQGWKSVAQGLVDARFGMLQLDYRL